MSRPQSLETIEARIAQLQAEAEAEELRARERAGVLGRIVDGMRAYRITLLELRAALLNGGGEPAAAEAAPPGKRGRKQSPEAVEAKRARMLALYQRVKYRDDKGNTWHGVGHAPECIKDWESKRGRSRDHWLADEFKNKA